MLDVGYSTRADELRNSAAAEHRDTDSCADPALWRPASAKPWIFSFNELSLHSAAAHRGKKVKKQIMELANIIRDFHLLSLSVCLCVLCGVWRAGPGPGHQMQGWEMLTAK